MMCTIGQCLLVARHMWEGVDCIFHLHAAHTGHAAHAAEQRAIKNGSFRFQLHV